MNPYLDFLKQLCPLTVGFGTERASVIQFDLSNGRIPNVLLDNKQRADYTHDLIWSLYNNADVQYLKLHYVDLWDRFVDPKTALWSDYTAVERFNLFGKEHLTDGFYAFIANLTSDSEKKGWTKIKKDDVHKWVIWDEDGNEQVVDYEPDNPNIRRELYVVEGEPKWLHPDIETSCHQWLDHNGVEGSAKMLIMGSVLPKHVPITGQGLDRFFASTPGEITRVEKRLPFEHFDSLIMQFSHRAIDREGIKQALVEARAAKDLDEAEAKYDQLYMHVPGFALDITAQCFRATSLDELEQALFQAGVLAHMVAESRRMVPGTLTVNVAEPHLDEQAVKDRIIALENPDPAFMRTHVFFNPRGLRITEFQWPFFEYL